MYAAGTPAATPVAPNIPGGAFLLRQIPVVAGATSITSSIDTRIYKPRYQNLGIVNVKDYGAIGDGNSHPLSNFFSTLTQAQAAYSVATALTDELDWCAIQTAINNSPRCKIVLPLTPGYTNPGVYIVNKELIVNNACIIEGEYALNAWGDYDNPQGDFSGSEIRLRSDIAAANTTTFNMINVTTTLPVLLQRFTINGMDGTWINQEANSYYYAYGTFDQYATFNGSNVNGANVVNLQSNFETREVKFKNISGLGLIQGTWQVSYDCKFSFCGQAVQINGGDGLVLNSFVHHCNRGIVLGDVANTLVCDTTRLINVRIEWIKDFGILLRHAHAVQISGFIERCGYAGIATDPTMSPLPSWHRICITAVVHRCGCFYRGANISQVPAGQEYKAANIYLAQPDNCTILGSNLKSVIYDDTAYTSAQAPTYGVYLSQSTETKVLPNFDYFTDDGITDSCIGVANSAAGYYQTPSKIQVMAANGGAMLSINKNTDVVTIDATANITTVSGGQLNVTGTTALGVSSSPPFAWSNLGPGQMGMYTDGTYLYLQVKDNSGGIHQLQIQLATAGNVRIL